MEVVFSAHNHKHSNSLVNLRYLVAQLLSNLVNLLRYLAHNQHQVEDHPFSEQNLILPLHLLLTWDLDLVLIKAPNPVLSQPQQEVQVCLERLNHNNLQVEHQVFSALNHKLSNKLPHLCSALNQHQRPIAYSVFPKPSHQDQVIYLDLKLIPNPNNLVINNRLNLRIMWIFTVRRIPLDYRIHF
jgi:hypothetical protein